MNNSKEIRAAIKNQLGYNSREVSVKHRAYYGFELTIRKANVVYYKVAEFAKANDFRLYVTDEVKETVALDFVGSFEELANVFPKEDTGHGVCYKGFTFFNERGCNIAVYGHDRDGQSYRLACYHINDVKGIAYEIATDEQKVQSEKAIEVYKIGDKRYTENWETKAIEAVEVVAIHTENNRVNYTVKTEAGKEIFVTQYSLVNYYNTKEELEAKQRENAEYKARLEENARQTEQFNNEVEIVELTEENQYEVIADFAKLNKNETLAQYKEEIAKGDYREEKVIISAEIQLNQSQWDFFTNNLLNGYGLGEFENVLVKNIETNQSIVVYGSGYDYARYVGVVEMTIEENEEIETLLETISNETTIEATNTTETAKEDTRNEFEKWLDTFIDEKELDLKHEFEIPNHFGLNLLVLTEHIKATSKKEQKAIQKKIVQIDFYNGDVMHFFNHLAKGLVANTNF